MAKVHTYRGKSITVTWDGPRCIHAAECLRWLPEVFDTEQKPWVQPDNASVDDVAKTVMLCPTGSLQYERTDGGPDEPKPGQNTVRVKPHGPLYVRGDVVLVTPEGEVFLEDTRIALCRCGASTNKPFCDNAHRHSGFRDPGLMQENKLMFADPAPEGTRLTITLNRNGSLRMQGPVTVRLANGAEVFGHRGSLCRCGQSKNKPFCDGTHKETGFATENSPLETRNSSKDCPALEDE